MYSPLDTLIRQLSKLPGFGQRSARRAVLHLLEHKDDKMPAIIETMQQVRDNIKQCESCFAYDVTSPCQICSNLRRDNSIICVVESMADVWAIERVGIYRGVYHVLHGRLSIVDKKTPESLKIPQLIAKCDTMAEIILATSVTLEGKTTERYIIDTLIETYPSPTDNNICAKKITRLSQGIPVGGELDFLDNGTLSAAFNQRNLL
jgi:recombination protein RecR